MSQGLKSRIKSIATGLTIPQEYCCIEFENFRHPLKVVLETAERPLKKTVTGSHLFLGYKPLIVGIVLDASDDDKEGITRQTQIRLTFENDNSVSVATLILSKISQRSLGTNVLTLYKGEHGAHTFLSSFHQRVNRQLEKLKEKSTGNIDLPGNLVDQVRIAYSIPRKISVITVSDGTLINLFPTDLHGKVTEQLYMSSLRKGGKANEQVERNKKIVIADVEASRFRETYALGKNHMKDLREEDDFEISPVRSVSFNFPLPVGVVRYRELNQIDTEELEIHRIHFYEIVHEVIVDESKPSLAHVHQYFAQWRLDHFKPLSILLR